MLELLNKNAVIVITIALAILYFISFVTSPIIWNREEEISKEDYEKVLWTLGFTLYFIDVFIMIK